jgi:hypothetical protein
MGVILHPGTSPEVPYDNDGSPHLTTGMEASISPRSTVSEAVVVLVVGATA